MLKCNHKTNSVLQKEDVISMAFFKNQSQARKDLYIKLLKGSASLSNMFTNSEDPYLQYRVMENIFCKAFEAENMSRADCSIDAVKNGIGIGLKTFLQKDGKTFQKIAEFNKQSYLFKNLDDVSLVNMVAKMRNERLITTKNIYGLKSMMYHVITRSKNHMSIYEEPMDLIDIDNLEITQCNTSTIHFTDLIHEYNFSLSKNTLLKRFNTEEEKKIFGFDVAVLENPYDILLK